MCSPLSQLRNRLKLPPKTDYVKTAVATEDFKPGQVNEYNLSYKVDINTYIMHFMLMSMRLVKLSLVLVLRPTPKRRQKGEKSPRHGLIIIRLAN